eukprot:CAMPEP_0113501730 /NCGR_PEP_ID=MMETSP0014_2-20120614/33124_1 /TAXON_ID=2857 /ORGANISM="Nitzschia sp." /LENGTH=658 /DNA_ID=CAMNT_0000396365 /DNA_START=95 /DNA_END=2068 /DNA_ORIENTATION=- /assembly_acc=CAM_ASM_000159
MFSRAAVSSLSSAAATSSSTSKAAAVVARSTSAAARKFHQYNRAIPSSSCCTSVTSTTATSSTSSSSSLLLKSSWRPAVVQIESSGSSPSFSSPQQQQQQQQRAFSSSSTTDQDQQQPTFSSYEYPTRTEAPEITKTVAQDVKELIENEPDLHIEHKQYSVEDPFDDVGTLSKDEINKRRKFQHDEFSAIKMNSVPIDVVPPPFIPSNVPAQELDVPETMITTLDNGIRVVSQETYSQMCTVGVLTNVGSRHEKVTGTVHLLETMAFGSTGKYDGLEINHLLQDWGATRFASFSREQTLHCIDILRPNLAQGMDLLTDVVLEPLIASVPEDVEHVKEVLMFQAQEMMPEMALGESLQIAAYGLDQQLGKLHFATPESISQLNPTVLEDFYINNIRNNPNGMVVAGAGIAHDELVDMTKDKFGTMHQESAPTTIKSTYRGGYHFSEQNDAQSVYSMTLPGEEQCRVALAFPVGGWHSDTMVTACVLQTLLGGGSSFSAGGPGKGMYTRMYQQVLNRYGWMETAEAFTTFADEGGLFGVSGSTPDPSKVLDLVTVLADQLARLAVQPVGDVELSRARNMLKCNVLTQLESRLILFEDMGRQILTYGKRENAATTCRKIDSVTAEDIQRLAQNMLQSSPPTFAASGYHLDKLPSYEEVSRW